MNNNQQNIQDAITWTPEIIVTLISEIIWPIIILIIAWKFKESIASGINNIFIRNNPTELSVGTSGFTAKFEASKQTEPTKTPKLIDPLPEGQDAESIKKAQIERSTQFSLEIFEKVQEHVNKLTLNDNEKIELLSTEVSLLRANLIYVDITSILFLSQYNLFNKYFYPQSIVTQEDVNHYFKEIKAQHDKNYEDWNVEQYLAYPLSVNLIEECDGGYKLTTLGTSYILHVRNNPTFLDYLTNL